MSISAWKASNAEPMTLRTSKEMTNIALHIANKEEAKKPDLCVTYVAALLHDMLDSKLIEAGTEENLEADLRAMVRKEMDISGTEWTEARQTTF